MTTTNHSRKRQVESKKFTDANVRDAKPGEYADTEVRYLRLYVSADGKSRTYGIYKWIAAKNHAVRRSLGLAGPGEQNVDDARKAAKALYDELKDGGDGKPDKEVTLGEALAEYTKKLERSKKRQPRWADEVFKRQGVYDDWLKKPMASITELMLDTRQHAIREARGPAAATRALKAIRAVYEFARAKKMFKGENVGKSVELIDSQPRKRVLNEIERDKIVAALDSPELLPYVRPFVRLLMVTGVRWGNLASAKWADVDLKNSVWTIRPDDSKMGNEIRVRLRPEAVDLFKEQVGKHEKWVFPSPKKSKAGHLTEPSYAWLRVLELAELDEHATLHDLRRTFGSVLIRGDVPMEVVKEALGHRSIATTEKHYAFMDDPTVLRHLNRVKA